MQNSYFLTKHPRPKNPRTWRRCPHVPSSFYHNVKEPTDKKPDTRPSLILLAEERVTYLLATKVAETLVSFASVEWRIWVALDSVNRVFAILFQRLHFFDCGDANLRFSVRQRYK